MGVGAGASVVVVGEKTPFGTGPPTGAASESPSSLPTAPTTSSSLAEGRSGHRVGGCGGGHPDDGEENKSQEQNLACHFLLQGGGEVVLLWKIEMQQVCAWVGGKHGG